jgi:hypothetical protein
VSGLSSTPKGFRALAGAVPSASNSDLRVADRPATIGKYRVLDRVGTGAFGAVYRCEDPTPRRWVGSSA